MSQAEAKEEEVEDAVDEVLRLKVCVLLGQAIFNCDVCKNGCSSQGRSTKLPALEVEIEVRI